MDLIFTGGRVLTMDDKETEAEAVAVHREKIIKVGLSAKVKERACSQTKVAFSSPTISLTAFALPHHRAYGSIHGANHAHTQFF